MTKRKTHVLLLIAILVFIFGLIIWHFSRVIFGSPFEGNLSHNFGIVYIERPWSTLEHTFRLTNKTNHTLQLVKATPTCGCTTTDWPKEPVPSGEDLVIPVHLKLRRSQLRRSEIRLEFKTGEVVVLHVEGKGRFKQPLVLTPNPIVINDRRNRAVLKLDWYEDGVPPEVRFKHPPEIKLESSNWRRGKGANAHYGTPNEWTRVLEFEIVEKTQRDISLEVEIEGYPPLVTPVNIEISNNIEQE
ncbi:MAG: DUF1573 domain-containing protein [Phycisphaerales bacterium]|nr:DUF1573 domain-containing protein [Phycisphaerales bacterium]